MRKNLLLISVFIFYAGFCLGNPQSEIFILNAETEQNDSLFAAKLTGLSDQLFKLDDSLSLIAISHAVSISQNNKDKYTRAELLYKIGKIERSLGNYLASIDHLKNALGLLDDYSQDDLQNIIMLDLGISYFLDGQTDKAMLFIQSAQTEYLKNGDSKGIMKCYYELAKVSLASGDINRASDQFNESLRISQLLNNKEYYILNRIQIHKINLENDNLSGDLKNEITVTLEAAKENNFNHLNAELYTILSKYYEKSGIFDSAYMMLNASLLQFDEIGQNNEAQLESILSDLMPKEKKSNSISLSMIILSFVALTLIIVIIFLVYRITKQKKNHQELIERCTNEIRAFNSSIGDLDTRVEEASQSRIKELDEELERAKQNKISLLNSQNNLIEVNRLKDVFLSKISHEIRTPLSTILGFAEILENQFGMQEEYDMYDFARNITDSGQSLVALLNNILDISKLNSDDFELTLDYLNPAALTNEVVENHKKDAEIKGLKIINDFNKCPKIYTDNVVFTKIVSSIVDNSIKFTEKGFIKVTVDHDKEKNSIVVIIKDTGTGIDKVYLDQVFEPYRQESLGYSTSYQGAGLGLPLAKKMTTKLMGSIQLESEKGSGTVVTIEFPIEKHAETKVEKPAATPEAETIEPPKKSLGLPWEDLSILVVEDDKMNQLLFEKMLKKAKNLEIAKDGKVALSIIEKNDEEFDVVLMDINLPPPWNGITLQKEIRSNYPQYVKIPFIAQTAYAISGNRESMLEEGFDEYITKPISKSILINVINKVIPRV